MIKPIKHIHDTGAYQYADGVLSGNITAGKYIYQACERFVNDTKREDIHLDLEAARKVVNYPALLQHWKGAKEGQPIHLEPYQQFYFQQMFGWKRTDTGLRRFTRSYKQIARKNGKTTELAIQGLYHCHVDLVSGPQFYVGATKEDQARLTLRDAENILPNEWIYPNKGWIYRPYKVGEFPRTLLIPQNKGALNTVGRDSKRSDGLDVSFAGIDEYHEHPDSSIRDILASAQGNRVEPMESIITTAGFNINGPCYQKSRDTGLKILSGVIEDDDQLVIIYEIDDYDQWQDDEQWICANPLMLTSDSLKKDLDSNFVRAKNEQGTTEVDFKTKRLNMWVNSPLTWIPHEIVKANNHGITDQELYGRTCYAGLDLSAGTDLNAYVLYSPEVRPGIDAVKCWFWIPSDKLRETKEADYAQWAKDGWVTVFDDSDAVEYDKIAHAMLQTTERYDVKVFACDPAYLNTGPASYINAAGKADLLIKVNQGRNLASGTEEIYTKCIQRRMDFMNNPVLTWNFSNVIVAMDENGHKYPSRKKSTNKIDGVSALCTAKCEQLRLSAEPAPIAPFVIGI